MQGERERDWIALKEMAAGGDGGGSSGDASRLVHAVKVAKMAWSGRPSEKGEPHQESGQNWKGAVDKIRNVSFIGKYSKEASRKAYVKELIKRAHSSKGGQKGRSASKASRMLRFSPATIYFLILEKDWWFCSLLVAICYAFPVVLFALISLPLELESGTADSELALHDYVAPQAIIAFRFSSANIIGMGYGTVVPTCNWGFFVAIMSQGLGIMINVFVFSAVLAKFQSPQADVIFSKKVCFFTRDGARHLCLRVGNLRCHTLYNPSLRLFVLSDAETAEGESFVRIEELEVGEPGTVSGVYNITHKIDEDSPLYRYGSTTKGAIMALQVIFTALDPVYQAEVCAKISYTSENFVFGHRFGDMMRVDNASAARGKRARPTLDFSCFEELVEVPEYWEEEEAFFVNDSLPMENSERPPKVSDKIGILIGFGRASYGDEALDFDLPKTGMRAECCFALSVAMSLLEAGEDYEEYRTDLGNKAVWHKDVNEKLETPALRMANQEEWLAGTDNIIDTLAASNPLVRELAKIKPPDHVNGTNAYYEPHMTAFALGMVHANPETAPPMRGFLFKKFGCEPEWDKLRCEAHIQVKAREILERWESALAAQGDFLCGSAPGFLDCRVVTKLYLAFQLFESGLANLGAPFRSIAPLAYDYVNRFAKRDSWKRAFGPGRGLGPNSKIDIVTVRTICNKFAMIAPEIVDEVVIPALEKARKKKSERKRKPKLLRRNSAALCL